MALLTFYDLKGKRSSRSSPLKIVAKDFFWATGKIFCCFLFPGRDISQFVMFSRQLHNTQRIQRSRSISFLEDVGVNKTSREIHTYLDLLGFFQGCICFHNNFATWWHSTCKSNKMPYLASMRGNETFWAIFKHRVCLFTFFACGK